MNRRRVEDLDLQSAQDRSVPSVQPTCGDLTWQSMAVRLFFTCWLVYVVHFSPNIVREIYPALSIGDHASFRVDEYAHLHPDLFETEGRGWHIGNNPGASMFAAVPYVLAKPLINFAVLKTQKNRAEHGLVEPPSYRSPWAPAREFYEQAWRKGLDIKFGLAALVMQAFCMAPSSALAVVFMFYLLRNLLDSDRKALYLSLLYAFATPVFFRTGYLNHNLMLGHIAFAGFIAMWNPSCRVVPPSGTRALLGGLAGGTAMLFDYSGVIFLVGLFLYVLAKRLQLATFRDACRHGALYVLGTLGPVFLLWFYQWKSFGNPFLPGQHWMPTVEWIDRGYQGYGWPQLELLWALAFDYRFGLFVCSPLMLLAIGHLFVRDGHSRLPQLELWAMLALCLALWFFFSGSNYTRLQNNTGIRYLAPLFPFLFVPAALTLMRLPRPVIYSVVIVSVVESWALAMHRDVEVGPGVLNPILHVFLDGFQLPMLTALSRMDAYRHFFTSGASPLPIFSLVGVVVFVTWRLRRPLEDTNNSPQSVTREDGATDADRRQRLVLS